MNSTSELDCRAALEALSARLDGELADERALLVHLARCTDCRAIGVELSSLSDELRALRVADPPPDLWQRIEARAGHPERRAPRPSLILRLAAGLIGFAGLGAAALVVERAREPRAPSAHLVDRLFSPEAPADLTALLAPLPEYQLLRRFPAPDEEPR